MQKFLLKMVAFCTYFVCVDVFLPSFSALLLDKDVFQASK